MNIAALQSQSDELHLQQQLLQGALPEDRLQPQHVTDDGLAASVITKLQKSSNPSLKKKGKANGRKSRKSDDTSHDDEEEEDSELSARLAEEEHLRCLFDPLTSAAREAALQQSLARAQAVASDLRAAVSQTMKTLLGTDDILDVNTVVGQDVPDFVVASSRRHRHFPAAAVQVANDTEGEEEQDRHADELAEQSNEVQVVTLEERLRDITAFLRDPSNSVVTSYVPRAVRRGHETQPDAKEQMNWFEEQIESVGESFLAASSNSFSVPAADGARTCDDKSSQNPGEAAVDPQRRPRGLSRRATSFVKVVDGAEAIDKLSTRGEDQDPTVAKNSLQHNEEEDLEELNHHHQRKPLSIAAEVDGSVERVCEDLGIIVTSSQKKADSWISLDECEAKVQEAKKKILEDVRRTFRVRYSLVCVREFDRLTSLVSDFATEIAFREAARQKEADDLKHQLEKKLAQSEALRRKMSVLSNAAGGVKRRGSQRQLVDGSGNTISPEQEVGEHPPKPAGASKGQESIAPFHGNTTHVLDASSAKEFGAYVSTVTTAPSATVHHHNHHHSPAPVDDDGSGSLLALQTPMMRKLGDTRHVAEQLEQVVMFQHDLYEQRRQKQRATRLQVGSVPLFRDQMIQTLTDDDLLLEGLEFVPLGPVQCQKLHQTVASRDEKMTELLKEAAKSVSIDWSLPEIGTAAASSSPKSRKGSVQQQHDEFLAGELTILQGVKDGVEELEVLRRRMMRRILEARCEKPVPSPTTTIVAVAEKLFHADSLLCDAFTEANVAVKGVLRSFAPSIVERAKAFVKDVREQARVAAEQAAEAQERLQSELAEVRARAAENEQRLNASLIQMQQSVNMSMTMSQMGGSYISDGQAAASPPRFGAAAAKQQAKAKAAHAKEEEAARLALQDELRRVREEQTTCRREYDILLSAILDMLRQASRACYPDIFQAAEVLMSQEHNGSVSSDAISSFFSMIIGQQLNFTSSQLIPQFAADAIASTSNLSELMISMCRALAIDVPSDIANKIEEYVVVADKIVVQSRKLKTKAATIASTSPSVVKGDLSNSFLGPDGFTVAQVGQFVKDSALCCGTMVRRLREYVNLSLRKQEEPLIAAIDELSKSLVGSLVIASVAPPQLPRTDEDRATEQDGGDVGESPADATLAHNEGNVNGAGGEASNSICHFEESEEELRDDVAALVEFILAAPRQSKPGQSQQIAAAARKLAVTFQKLHVLERRTTSCLQDIVDKDNDRKASMVDAECTVAVLTEEIGVETARVEVCDEIIETSPVMTDDAYVQSDPAELPLTIDVGAGPDEEVEDDDEDEEEKAGIDTPVVEQAFECIAFSLQNTQNTLETLNVGPGDITAALPQQPPSDGLSGAADPVVVRRKRSSAAAPSMRSVPVQTDLRGASIEDLQQRSTSIKNSQLSHVLSTEDFTAVSQAIVQLQHTFSFLSPVAAQDDDNDDGEATSSDVPSLKQAAKDSFASNWKDTLQSVDQYLTGKLKIVFEENQTQTEHMHAVVSAATSPRPTASMIDASVACEILSPTPPSHAAIPSLSRLALPPLSPQSTRTHPVQATTTKSKHAGSSDRPRAEHGGNSTAGHQLVMASSQQSPRQQQDECSLSPRIGGMQSPRLSPRRQQEAGNQAELLVMQKKRLEDARLDQQHQTESHHVLMSCLQQLLRHSRHLSKMILPDPFEQAIPHAPPIPFSRREFDLQLMHNIHRFLVQDGRLAMLRFRFAVLGMMAEQKLLRFLRWRRNVETAVLRSCAPMLHGFLPRRVVNYLSRAERKLRQHIIDCHERRQRAVAEQKFARAAFMTTAIAPVVVGLQQFAHQILPIGTTKQQRSAAAPAQLGSPRLMQRAELRSPKDLPSSQLDELDKGVMTQLDSRAGTCSTAQGQRRHSGSLGVGDGLVQTPLHHDREPQNEADGADHNKHHHHHHHHRGEKKIEDVRTTEHFIGATTFETVDVQKLPGTFSREAGVGGDLGKLPPLSRIPIAGGGAGAPVQPKRLFAASPHQSLSPEPKQDHLFAALVAKSDDLSEVIRRNNWKGVVRVANVVEKSSTPEPFDSRHVLVVNSNTNSSTAADGGRQQRKNAQSVVSSQHPPHARMLVQPQRTTIMKPERGFATSFLSGKGVPSSQK